MNTIIETCFEIPKEIMDGLLDGTYYRDGGIIRRSAGKTYKAFLKEIPLPNGNNSQVLSQLNSVSSEIQLTNALQLVNLGVSIAGFAMTTIKLNKISNQIADLTEYVKEVKEITLINRKINFYEIISNYQNFEVQLRDFSLALNKEERKHILSQAYNDMSRNRIVLSELLKDEKSIKSLAKNGAEMITMLHRFLCLSYRSQIAYNIFCEEHQVVKKQLHDAKETLFSVNKNLVKVHRNLGWTDYVLPVKERQQLQLLLDKSIEVEKIYETKIIYSNIAKETEQIDLNANYQLALIRVS